MAGRQEIDWTTPRLHSRPRSAAGSRGHGAEARQASFAWPVCWSTLFGGIGVEHVATLIGSRPQGVPRFRSDDTANNAADKGHWDTQAHSVHYHASNHSLQSGVDMTRLDEPGRPEKTADHRAADRGSNQPEHDSEHNTRCNPHWSAPNWW